uniref:MD-2-related lipid-recognition domain-containing protein n=1 Tax=Anopheles farauti TaxID=69004 RepID=A0A499FUS8_9DIPT
MESALRLVKLLVLINFLFLTIHFHVGNTIQAGYSLKIKKYVCIDAPYKETTLHYCKNLPRRNAPTMVNVSLHVPKLYNFVLAKVKMFYKFSTYQPFVISLEVEGCKIIANPPTGEMEKFIYSILNETVPELLLPCPAGNRTYNIVWYLREKHTLQNSPPGDYKIQFKITSRNAILFAIEIYCEVRNTGFIDVFVKH